MTYLEQLHTAHVERMKRFSRIEPPPVSPKFKTIHLDAAGRRVFPPPPPRPPLPKIKAPPLPRSVTFPIRMSEVIRVVAKEFCVSAKELTGRSRTHPLTFYRQIMMYLGCTMTGRSLPDTGRRLGGFDHSTILYARDKITRLMNESPELKERIIELRGKLMQTAQHELDTCCFSVEGTE